MDRDIVLVMFNYRLASLGFLAMGTKEAPGNSGMKDQVLVLRWVQKNIEKFGGNKNLVTIFGYSAGGFSVTAHLASPMSKNLFHRAIAMSGSITTTSTLRRKNVDSLEKFEKMLNCSSDKLLDCLRKVQTLAILVWLKLIKVFSRHHHKNLCQTSRITLIVKSFTGFLSLKTILAKKGF